MLYSLLAGPDTVQTGGGGVVKKRSPSPSTVLIWQIGYDDLTFSNE